MEGMKEKVEGMKKKGLERRKDNREIKEREREREKEIMNVERKK